MEYAHKLLKISLKDENENLKEKNAVLGALFRGLPISKRGRSPSNGSPTPDQKRQKQDAPSKVHLDLSVPAPAPIEGSEGSGTNPPLTQQPDQAEGNGTPSPNVPEEGQVEEVVVSGNFLVT